MPEHLKNRLIVMVAVCHHGDAAAAEASFLPLRTLTAPDVDYVERTLYADFQCSIDDPPGFRNWWAASNVDALSDEAIDTIHASALAKPDGPSQIFIVPWGGAVARVAPESSPIVGRHSAWVVHPLAMWEKAEDDAKAIAWGRALRDAMREHANDSVFLNFVSGEDARPAAGWGADAARLAQIKRNFDPDGVFQGTTRSRSPPGPRRSG